MGFKTDMTLLSLGVLSNILSFLIILALAIAIIVLPIYFTFDRAFKETGGTRVGYIILGLLLTYILLGGALKANNLI